MIPSVRPLRRLPGVVAFALFAGTAALAVLPAQARAGDLPATVRLAYTGSSTLHDWEGTAPAVQVTLHESIVPSAWDGEFRVPVAGLDSGNGTRDANMRKMFRADVHPDIRIVLRAVDPAAVRRDQALTASLTIGDITKDVPVKVAGWKQQGGLVSFEAEADVSLLAFGLEAPTVLGIVRVADRVKVTGRVEIASPHP